MTASWPKSPSGKAFKTKIDSIPIADPIRRKRQRLTSNDPIETAPTTRICASPHLWFGAVPIGIYCRY